MSKTKLGPVQTDAKQNFTRTVGDSGAALFVLDKKANHPDSIKLLDGEKLRPLRYQEALLLLMKDETLRKAVEGKCFYLSGAGLDKELLAYTVNAKGELVEIVEGISPEKTVFVMKGNGPLSLDVVLGPLEDDTLTAGRYCLNAYLKPDHLLSAVVGVPKDWSMPMEMLRLPP